MVQLWGRHREGKIIKRRESKTNHQVYSYTTDRMRYAKLPSLKCIQETVLTRKIMQMDYLHLKTATLARPAILPRIIDKAKLGNHYRRDTRSYPNSVKYAPRKPLADPKGKLFASCYLHT